MKPIRVFELLTISIHKLSTHRHSQDNQILTPVPILPAITMSGFEVAGIVLGSFPIIVGALELYIKGASTIQKWRIFNRRLKSLLNSVETEQVKLKNVYEKLLWDIAPPTQIEEMIDDPFGPLWKSPGMYVKVRQRLQRSLNVFERNVEELRDIVDEIKEKLEIQPDGKVGSSLLIIPLPISAILPTFVSG